MADPELIFRVISQNWDIAQNKFEFELRNGDNFKVVLPSLDSNNILYNLYEEITNYLTNSNLLRSYEKIYESITPDWFSTHLTG